MITSIDLNIYMNDKKIFVGKDFGEEVRLKSNVDFKFKTCDLVMLIIPHDVNSINPSFFKQLISNIVEEIGVDEFESKLDVLHYGNYNYQSVINESISRIKRDMIQNAGR
jgi:hypothetical protein